MQNPKKLQIHSGSVQGFDAKINMMFPLIQHLVVAVLAGLIMDEGETLQAYGYAVLAYWGGFGIIMARRRGHLTGVDRVLIHWGFPMLCVVASLIAAFVWHLRGYW